MVRLDVPAFMAQKLLHLIPKWAMKSLGAHESNARIAVLSNHVSAEHVEWISRHVLLEMHPATPI